jgi:hypothetical protein
MAGAHAGLGKSGRSKAGLASIPPPFASAGVTMRKTLLFAAAAALVLAGSAAAQPAGHVTTPKEALGHEIGEDYFLATYSQLASYWKTLAAQSDRARLVEIGKTAEGRPQYMMIVSSPENLKNLDKYRSIAARLAKAKGLTPDQAHALAKEGKSVVWIDGGLHAAEVEPAQALMLAVYKALTDNDPEWMRILNDDIILFAQDNPDGQELVANWYMRNPDPTKRVGGVSTVPDALAATPQLYHHYIGHDNNRDFYMSAQPETTNINRVLFREWYPQIIYNHHQTGPTGAVVFMPPFRDPFNYNYDPLIMTELSEAGAAMHSRLVAEEKPGSTMRSGANYSTWFNGSLRTISYFHNAIGILTEIIGNPTPMPLPMVPKSQLPHNDLPMPVAPQTWHLKQSIDYSMSMNRSLLDYASRNRERLLFNIYKMGADSIQRGSEDSWTVTAKDIDALEAAAKGKPVPPQGGVDPKLFQSVLRDPAKRDARAYVIPADQADFPTAVKFLNALIKTGVDVERATAPFSAGGKTYPAGSYVVLAAQAYRPHVLDMFEAQHHPQDFEYPGGPPVRPYDTTGYTLAYQMGVRFDRVLEDVKGPFQPVPDLIAPPAAKVAGAGKAGYLVSHELNDSFVLTNRLLRAKLPVYWVDGQASAEGHDLGRGAIWIPASPRAKAIVETAAASLGVPAYAVDRAPAGKLTALKAPRIALVDVYGGSMSSGWDRWLLEQFEFPYQVVYPQRLDAGGLRKAFDVILMPDSLGVPSHGRKFARRGPGQPKAEDIPAEYRSWLGTITADKTAPQLQAFLKAGGAILAVGDSTGVADMLHVPVADPLVTTSDGKTTPLPDTKFYIPGSILEAQVSQVSPLTYGVGAKVPVFFDSSPVFRIAEGARGVSPVVTFQGKDPLMSGWALGQSRLDGTVAIADACVEGGHLFLMGPEINQRAQSHASFKFMFNGLYYGATSAAAQACR